VGWGRNLGLLLGKSRALDLDGVPALVVPANGAYVVRAPWGPALGAACEAGQLQGQVATPFTLARLRIAFLWQWGHCLFLPFRLRKQACKGGPGVIFLHRVAVAVTGVQVLATLWAKATALQTAQRLHSSGCFSILPYCFR
jgi:hypothetical protein